MVVELYPALWETLDEMRLNVEGKFNNKTQKDAFSFFKAIDSFDFIINLITTYKIFNYTLLVTKLLQSKNNDIADGVEMIESLVSLFKEIRRHCDRYYDKWYQEAVEIAERFQISISKPRTTNRQILRANHPSDSISNYYKLS